MKADFIFETSWEVCNKVGGIHTVISTKALNIVQELGDDYVLIGPDVWREDVVNPEFIPDNTLFSDWMIRAADEELRVKAGRWNIAGKPIVILIDFTPYFGQQNEIFTRFWEAYKLDSISGQWDYVEPALFGFAAGKVIESFTNFYHDRHNIIAQFHEWMTGTGILYLKTVTPWIGTSFTTHATVLGRSIAGNNKPLYGKMREYNPALVAREFNVVAKQSLEKISAAEASVFTTVSELTSSECSHFLGKDVDIVTPNGFEDSFVPDENHFEESRTNAKLKLRKVAEAVLGYSLSKDCLFIASSGRYEYRNKGVDIFIDSLGELMKDDIKKECVTFIMMPAYHKGPRQDLVDILYNNGTERWPDRYLTHSLHYPLSDPILLKIAENNLLNDQKTKVKILFVPCYLNGNDGIFNMPYFDILIGFDLTVFPSYYEPWGYTPLESLMFSIPTVTTSLSGFGLWVEKYYENIGNGMAIIERTDDNEKEVVVQIRDFMAAFAGLSGNEIKEAREKAHSISRIAMWDSLIDYYFNAYDMALERVAENKEEPRETARFVETTAVVQIRKPHQVPVWKDIYVQSDVPERLAFLEELAGNLWWSWNNEAESLFKRMDPSLWEGVSHNPKMLLEKIDYKRLLVLEDDDEFARDLEKVQETYRRYIDRPDDTSKPKVAYFSMEFGIHPCLKIYSGGLGVLAGDYLKEASDSNVRITGIGLLYRYGYFKQKLGPRGDQIPIYVAEDFSRLPVCPVNDPDGNQLVVCLAWPGRTVRIKIWEARIGKVRLILLDTDFEDNSPEDRTVTHYLYGGDNENRLRQELVLGIGGIRALSAMGITPDVYHSNEGHSAFISFERFRTIIEEHHLTFNQALEIIRSSTLFTTHTPVPAGHDSFDEDLLRKYIPHYHGRLNISWDELMALGRSEGDTERKFNMSYLAARMSQEINGVSKLHGEVSQAMFNKLWPGYLKEELFIGYVTNGVHFPTWAAREWKEVYEEFTGTSGFDQTDRSLWEKIYIVDDKRINEIKRKLKRNLFENIRKRLQIEMIEKHESPRTLMSISSHLDEKALTIGFARRFATYKRATLLFRDLDRLERIVNDPKRPVQFIYAGKAHPNDGGGQGLIKRIFEVSQMPKFTGKVIFLENYDIELAKSLIRGVDVWLNTPTRPLEASGTSGEKAVMNGTIHFSVLDGWWVEGYHAYAGWALPKKRIYENQDLQDDIDAETIYNMLEYEVIPAYYSFNEEGISEEWINLIKNTMVKVAPEFTMKRQLDDYFEKYYTKLHVRNKYLSENNYQKAKELAGWKIAMREEWDNIEVLNYSLEKTTENIYHSGHEYKAGISLNIGKIPKDNVGLELIIARMKKNGEYEFVAGREFELVSYRSGKCVYKSVLIPEKAGSFFYGIRIYPKHTDLPHKQDFYLLRWID